MTADDDTVTIPRELAERAMWLTDDDDIRNEFIAILHPPKPLVTDEMVEAVMAEVWGGDQAGMPFVTRAVLEAVERLGWLRDPNANLESAAAAAIVTADEAEYLRSLNGEGE